MVKAATVLLLLLIINIANTATDNETSNGNDNMSSSWLYRYLRTVFPESDVNVTDVQNDRQRPDYTKSSAFVCRGVLSPMIASFGILGNVVILVVLTRKHMVSTTNCFLTALAVSDTLLLLVQIPADLAFIPELWSRPRFRSFSVYYFLIWNGMHQVFRITTCWLTTAVVVERYLALRFFTHPRLVCSLKRARIVATAIFLGSAVFNFVKFFEFELKRGPGETTVVITRMGLSLVYENLLYPADCVVSIVLPVVLMVVFNGLLLHSLVAHRRQMLRHGTRVNLDVLHVGMVVFTVVLVFLLSYSAHLWHYLDSALKKTTDVALLPEHVSVSFWHVRHVLVTVNSSVNVVVYACLNRKFRRTLTGLARDCRKRASGSVMVDTLLGVFSRPTRICQAFSPNGGAVSDTIDSPDGDKVSSGAAATKGDAKSNDIQRCPLP